MSGFLTPANIIVVIVVAVGLVFGFKRIAGMSRGKSCCSDGESKKRIKKIEVEDTDPSHYAFEAELLIGGMSCDGCAQNVANALNALPGVWATVDFPSHTAHVRSKEEIDRDAFETAVKDAGYYVMKL